MERGHRDERFDAVDDHHAEHLRLDGEGDVRDGVDAVEQEVDTSGQVFPGKERCHGEERVDFPVMSS